MKSRRGQRRLSIWWVSCDEVGREGDVPWGFDVCECAVAIDVVFDPVEGEFGAEELEQLLGGGFGEVGLKVHEVQVGLVVDFFARATWEGAYLFG